MAESRQSEEKPLMILVVDDGLPGRRMIVKHLRSAGYEVIEARDGQSALTSAQYQRPGLIILDLSLPDLDGIEVLGILRKDSKTAAIPVIVCSARGSKHDVVQATKSGATDFIVKPVSPQTLLARVRRFALKHEGDASEQHDQAGPETTENR